MLKFYDREKEIEQLLKIEEMSHKNAQMTFVVGRRRIGKTTLLNQVFQAKPGVYFFVEKKNEVLLCEEFVSEIKNKLGVEVFGELRRFKDVFGFLINLSKTQPFTLIIDEFQEFRNVNPAIYSEMQNIWDANKDDSKINLILCGSAYSLMTRIFEQSKEPLFGRATAKIHVKSFDIDTLKEIIGDHKPTFSNEDLLAFYLITGGVAKYVELLVQAQTFSLESIVEEIFTANSLFLEEGKNVLIDEFGKEYGNYFSVLSLIALSKTSRSEIETVLGINVGGYLDKLEREFDLIRKIRPIFAKPASKNVKYRINDNFLNFWFRFIYKYRSAVEMENFQYLKEIFMRDYTVYSGQILERYFIEKMIKEENLSQIGAYWEKKNLNEIDIVAVNEYEKRAIIAEVKRNPDKMRINILKEKSKKLIAKHLSDYKIEYRGLSMDDM